MDIMSMIKPELLILVPVIYVIGLALKKAKSFSDERIPLVLGIIGILVAGIYVFATTELTGTQQIAMAIFTAIVQGILCAAAPVFGTQIAIQGRKIKEADKTSGI